jgi:hypothetical protein
MIKSGSEPDLDSAFQAIPAPDFLLKKPSNYLEVYIPGLMKCLHSRTVQDFNAFMGNFRYVPACIQK